MLMHQDYVRLCLCFVYFLHYVYVQEFSEFFAHFLHGSDVFKAEHFVKVDAGFVRLGDVGDDCVGRIFVLGREFLS